MSEAEEYILGVDGGELERLRSQHAIWAPQMRDLLEHGGLARGATVLDLGCGPGATTLELARCVGEIGRVIACDESAEFIEILRAEAAREGHTNVEAHVRKAEALGLERASLDAAYGRWILSWLPDAEGVFEQLARALKPGGVYLLQEYLDWGAMNILPERGWFRSGVNACMESWKRGGGTINVSRRVPEFAVKHGFEIESFEIQARSGKPGSPVWRWMSEFYESYLQRLADQGHYDRGELRTFLAGWAEAGRQADTVVVAPVVADIVLRKPLA